MKYIRERLNEVKRKRKSIQRSEAEQKEWRRCEINREEEERERERNRKKEKERKREKERERERKRERERVSYK